jgi:hypothetical protein
VDRLVGDADDRAGAVLRAAVDTRSALAAPSEKHVAFADPVYMVDRRSDVLYAKIRRGGMGTDMPNFGTLFTPDESWALVEYLWTMPFAVRADTP